MTAAAADRAAVVAAVHDLQAERDRYRDLLDQVTAGSRLVHPAGHVAVIVPEDVMAAADEALGRTAAADEAPPGGP